MIMDSEVGSLSALCGTTLAAAFALAFTLVLLDSAEGETPCAVGSGLLVVTLTVENLARLLGSEVFLTGHSKRSHHLSRLLTRLDTLPFSGGFRKDLLKAGAFGLCFENRSYNVVPSSWH